MPEGENKHHSTTLFGFTLLINTIGQLLVKIQSASLLVETN